MAKQKGRRQERVAIPALVTSDLLYLKKSASLLLSHHLLAVGVCMYVYCDQLNPMNYSFTCMKVRLDVRIIFIEFSPEIKTMR